MRNTSREFGPGTHICRRLCIQNLVTLHWDQTDAERNYRSSFPSLNSVVRLAWKEEYSTYTYRHQLNLVVPDPETIPPPCRPFEDPDSEICKLACNSLVATSALQIARVLFDGSDRVLACHLSPMTVKYLVEVDTLILQEFQE